MAFWLLAASGVDAAGQELALEVRAGTLADQHGASVQAITAESALILGDARSSLALAGEGAFTREGWMRSAAGLRLRLRSRASGPLVALGLDGSGVVANGGPSSFGVSVSPRGGYGGVGWRVEGGPHLGIAGWKSGAAPVGEPIWPGGPVFGPANAAAYETAPLYGMFGELRVGKGPVSWSGAWRTSRMESVRWWDLQGELALQAAPLTLTLEGGVRGGGGSSQWGGVGVAVRVTDGFALVGSAGHYVVDPIDRRIGGTRAELGFRLHTGATPGRAVPAPVTHPPGAVRLTLRARPGARVELAADWTGWTPVAVGEREPGLYEAVVRLPAGTHRFVFVVDGVRRTPEGHLTEPDGFGGRQAVVHIADR